MYNKKKKKFRSFGIGKNKTLLTLPIVSVFMSSIIFFIIFLFIDDSPNNSNLVSNITLNQIPISSTLSTLSTVPLSQNIYPITNSLLTGGNIPFNINLNNINSIIEAGIKAKIMENLSSNISNPNTLIIN